MVLHLENVKQGTCIYFTYIIFHSNFPITKYPCNRYGLIESEMHITCNLQMKSITHMYILHAERRQTCPYMNA